MSLDSVSRRSLLEAVAAAIAVGLMPSPVVELARAAYAGQGAAQAGPGSALSFFTPAEAADVDAITAQIIPTDDTPGAREAGVVAFIDRAMATFLSQLAGEYRAQLAEFQAACRVRHAAAVSFAALGAEQQRDYLSEVEHTPFFATTHLLTVLGMFSLPEYGGNRAGAGWALLGFEDKHVFRPPFGYYDRGYQGTAAQEDMAS